MILVTGATGQLGKATIEFLLKKPNAGQLAVLARDSQKTEMKEFLKSVYVNHQ